MNPSNPFNEEEQQRNNYYFNFLSSFFFNNQQNNSNVGDRNLDNINIIQHNQDKKHNQQEQQQHSHNQQDQQKLRLQQQQQQQQQPPMGKQTELEGMQQPHLNQTKHTSPNHAIREEGEVEEKKSQQDLPSAVNQTFNSACKACKKSHRRCKGTHPCE